VVATPPRQTQTSLRRSWKVSSIEPFPEFTSLVEKPLLHCPHRLLFHVKRGLRVLVLVDVNAVSHNIGSRLGVQAQS